MMVIQGVQVYLGWIYDFCYESQRVEGEDGIKISTEYGGNRR